MNISFLIQQSQNLEEQIQEVLNHIRTNPQPELPAVPIKQVEVKTEVTQQPTSTSVSPSASLIRRTAQLEDQLQLERENMRVIEERTRVCQNAQTEQHKVV